MYFFVHSLSCCEIYKYLEFLLWFPSLEIERNKFLWNISSYSWFMIHDSGETRFTNKNRMTSFFVILGSSETNIAEWKEPKTRTIIAHPIAITTLIRAQNLRLVRSWFSVFGIRSQLHRSKIERSIVINFPITQSSMSIVFCGYSELFCFFFLSVSIFASRSKYNRKMVAVAIIVILIIIKKIESIQELYTLLFINIRRSRKHAERVAIVQCGHWSNRTKQNWVRLNAVRETREEETNNKSMNFNDR